MVVSIAASTNGSIISHTGTLQEVMNSLAAYGINNIKNVTIYYNGTNITAIHIKRSG